MTAVLFAPQIEDDATRRQFLIGGLSVAVLLTGCGGGGSALNDVRGQAFTVEQLRAQPTFAALPVAQAAQIAL